MIKIVFYKHDGVYYGFKETGHAGYDEAGKDIVCAAVSSMTMLIMNAAEVVWGSNIDYDIDEKTSDVTFIAKGALEEFEDDEKIRFALSGLIYAYYLQIADMLEDYYDYIDFSEEERNP